MSDAPSVAARLTPYELVFIDGDFESRVFPRIEREAVETGTGALDPDQFEFLSTAADVVREVTPDEAMPETLEQYRMLLFHAFNFWRSGRRLYVLDASTARYLVETSPSLADWAFTMPGSSAYLQLPANLFWSSISPESTPEPVDGFFLTLTEPPDDRTGSVGRLEVLAVLGIHRSRAGFSIISLGTELGPGVEEVWASPERADGDFQNELPGGEIAGLYSMLTTGEVLKLIGRAFAYVDRFPDCLIDVVAAEPRLRDADPPPTRLAHTRITLGSSAAPAAESSE